MKIAVLGSGNVGGALGTQWARAGHAVLFASRNPNSEEMLQLIARAGANAHAMSSREAVEGADVVLLATPWGATESVIAHCGGLAEKIVLDATNPLGPGFALTHRGDDSGGEQVQRWAPQARVVKVFNTTGYGNMENPVYDGKPSLMFYAGDDSVAKDVARQLSDVAGFESIDAGPLENARLLEAWAVLWIKLAMQYGHGRDFAFVKLTR
ncbi:MAG: NADPH-dependent F420 reductase [Acidobacteria bacterium]|nr:NADPH-dependent F420 reductase [Acidobacteriota bacterium]